MDHEEEMKKRCSAPFVRAHADLCRSAYCGDDTLARAALAKSSHRLGGVVLAAIDACAPAGCNAAAPAPPSALAMGHEARKLFYFSTCDPTNQVQRLNHGSYGAPFLACAQLRRELLDVQMRQPLAFVQADGGAALAMTIAAAARFLGLQQTGGSTPAHSLHLVDNATSGVAAVVRSISPLGAGDAIVSLTHTYPSIRHGIERRCAESGATHVTVNVEADGFTAARFLAALRDTLETGLAARGLRPRLVVLDHISSAAAIRYPLREAVELCRAAGALVAVDAAHTIGALEIDMDALGRPDFYCSNMHKWCNVPLSCAVLYVADDRASAAWLRPTLDSHGADSGDIADRFVYGGTRDLGGWMAAACAWNVFESLGGIAAVAARAHAVARACAAQLVALWGTRTLVDLGACGGGSGNRRGCECSFAQMACIEIPGIAQPSQDAVDKLVAWFFAHDVEIMPVFVEGRVWLRVSAAIYVEVDDYITAVGKTMIEAVRELEL
jgi:selenocysteine lyase/cysteine desulfurase